MMAQGYYGLMEEGINFSQIFFSERNNFSYWGITNEIFDFDAISL